MKVKEAMPITVDFKANIRTDGEFCKIKISQIGNSLYLTELQAISLGRVLFKKYTKEISEKS